MVWQGKHRTYIVVRSNAKRYTYADYESARERRDSYGLSSTLPRYCQSSSRIVHQAMLRWNVAVQSFVAPDLPRGKGQIVVVKLRVPVVHRLPLGAS